MRKPLLFVVVAITCVGPRMRMCVVLFPVERDTQQRTQQEVAQRTNYGTRARPGTYTCNSNSFLIRYIVAC
jgi:hypothetical protein